MNVMTNTTMNNVELTFTKPNMPLKTTASSTEETSPPKNCHGRKRPHLVLVLSTRLPSSGSTKISAMRMITTRLVMTPISLAASALSTPENRQLVTYTMKYVLIAL